jgi:hypothetical protein
LSEVDEDDEEIQTLAQKIKEMEIELHERNDAYSFIEAERKIIGHDSGLRSPQYGSINRKAQKLRNDIEKLEYDIKRDKLKLKIIKK